MIERDDPQDKELASLYREAAGEQPSAGLDARILAAARATTTPPKVVSQSWLNRWKIPVALAATVLLTTTLTLLVQEEEAGRLTSPDTGAMRAPLPAKEAASPPPAAPAPAPAEPPLKAARPTTKPMTGPAPAPSATGSLAKEREIPAASSAQPVPDSYLNLGGAAAERKTQQAAPAAAESRTDALRDQPAREKTRQEIQAAPPSPMAAPSPAARSMAAPAAKHAETDQRSPDQWLDDIRRLRREGRAQEADASLAEFRQRYPQYVLPDDLKQP